MSQRDFTEVEPQGTPELPAVNRSLFLDKVRQSNAACQSGDFATAVALYTDALQLDPTNHILYSNRSAARLKQGHFNQALQDAVTARDLCPTWPKAYYRQGVALQCLDRHGEALAAFSSGLAQDPTSQQLMNSLLEASIKSPLRHRLEPTFQQLKLMKLDQSPFVLISVVGQELLAAGIYRCAIVVLESALKIGSCSLKLRGSVFSALSSAHWALNELDKAIAYMQQDLAIAKSLGDTCGECRAHGNLGSAYFSQGSYKEALTAHRYQLVLAMKCKDTQAAAIALTSLGHVYTAIGDYPNALASHKQCVQLVKQMGDRLQEAREIGNVGAVYLAMGDFDSAVDCHMQHLRLARRLSNSVEEARAFSNLGSSHHYRRNFAQAIVYHEKVLRIAQTIGDKSVESRAYAGLGHAARCAGDYVQAKHWHERQLDIALSCKDKVGEGRACSNLGIVYQLLGEYDAALKLHQAHLVIARNLQDRAGMGRAYGNIGNAYSAAGFYESAIKYHKQELCISKQVHDRSSEASTHGNLAVAYQAIGAHDMALFHYRAHLNIARELKDTAGEACALLNLGNCLSSRNEFSEAIPYYEQYLMFSQELSDVEGEAKACHFLGYAHYCIGNFREAVRYYDQDLILAKDMQDKMNMGRAYCNLGLAHLALDQLSTSLECQKYFLAIAHMTNNQSGKFKALGNIGDVLSRMGDVDEAIKMYHRQLALARSNRDRSMEATACGALGIAHRQLKQFDKALGYHTQELTLRQEMSDLTGECKAHGHLGSVHMSLGNYTHAVKCYQEQLERAQELPDSVSMEAQAFGNLGIARLNMGHYEDAIGYLEQQLATLERSHGNVLLEKARAYGSMGDCYDALGDFEDAVKCHEQYLNIVLKMKSSKDQERAYRGLGLAQKSLGNLQQVLVCFEKRLVVAHELGSLEAKASAYSDLGMVHSQLGNSEQAIKCMEHQQNIARDLDDKQMESEALSGLGYIYQQISEFTKALEYYKKDLEIAQEIGLAKLQIRACANLGSIFEKLGNFQMALEYQQQHLNVANSTEDLFAKSLALGSLGRVHQLLGNTNQAISYLSDSLSILETLNRQDEEAKIRHRLGMVLSSSGNLEEAQKHFETAVELLDHFGRDSKIFQKSERQELQSLTYQMLQKTLIELQKPEEALLVAEKSRAKAFNDTNDQRKRKDVDVTLQQIFDIVNRQRALVLYFSLAAGFLYSWLLAPMKGILKFNSTNITEVEDDSNCGVLQQLTAAVKDTLNEDHTISEDHYDDSMSDRPGFLRMVNRSHLLNSSNYSLSSLFSVGSVGGSVASLRSSTRSSHDSKRHWYPYKGPSCLNSLYALLIEPFEEILSKKSDNRSELILVLENDLFLVPFPVLRSQDTCSEYLSERFSLLSVPNLNTLKMKANRKEKSKDLVKSLIVGNPKLPASVVEEYGWKDMPQADHEAKIVAELLQSEALVGIEANKSKVLSEILDVECVHFATHISWKLKSLILSPGTVLEQTPTKSQKVYMTDPSEEQEDSGDEVSTEVPSLNEFLLSSEDISKMKLNAKLVVISSSHGRGEDSPTSWATSEGLYSLVKALINAGASTILLCLWPVPDTAIKIFLRAFYSSLMQGTRASRALAEAMQTVQHTKHFAHPANWAGFLLIGSNVRLSNKVALMGQALCELLKSPEKCRDALRVTLHLVEKSLQRIHRGQKNAMYTTQKSIENKVGSALGWNELLMSVGFRFEPASNGIPSSVFFPQSDPDERLTQCSASLQALLGLSATSIQALSKLASNFEVADDIIAVIQSALTQFEAKNHEVDCVDVALNVRLWRVPGIHELLASLGFDLCDVGQDKVTLRTKLSNKRNIQFTLQALLALFDTQEAPKSLSVDSSSSLESLASNDNELSYSDNEELIVRKPPSRRVLPPIRLGTSSAFQSYVRRRGEPDGGHTTNQNLDAVSSSSNNSLMMRKTQLARPGGGESDAAFTPSPPVQSGDLAIGLVHQSKIRNLYPQAESGHKFEHRPDSSSSSSLNDWDHNLGTVLRRQRAPPIPPPRLKNFDLTPLYNNLLESSDSSDLEKQSSRSKHTKKVKTLVDKLSVRTNGDKVPAQQKRLLMLPNEEPSGSSSNERLLYFSPKDGVLKPTKNDGEKRLMLNSGIRDDMTPSISEVYHERNLGLGLAPSLSKLLLNNGQIAVPQVDNLGGVSVLEQISKNILFEDSPEEEGRDGDKKKPWLNLDSNVGHVHSSELTTADILEREVLNKKSNDIKRVSPFSEMSRRDEGDGRSLADSSYSSYKNQAKSLKN